MVRRQDALKGYLLPLYPVRLRHARTTQSGIEGAVLTVEVTITEPEADHAGAHPYAVLTDGPREHHTLLAGGTT